MRHTECCFVTYASFVLYWIYDPTRINENYRRLDVRMQKNTNKTLLQILYNFNLISAIV